MTNFTFVRARVSPESKVAAMANVKSMGLDLSTVLRMVVDRLAVSKDLPFDLIQPNQETIRAISDLENGVGIYHANTIEELKNDLGWK